MTILVIAEVDNAGIVHTTRSVVSAAKEIGGDVHLLVATGSASASSCKEQAVSLDGVNKVLLCADDLYSDYIAENLALLVQGIASNYSHILAPASTYGKDFMPRVAALLDMSQVSDIIAVESADTFIRPIYAGNALAKVQSSAAIKIITVRPSAFDKVAGGGNAEIEEIAAAANANLSQFVKLEGTQSERPDLTAANVVVSGGRGLASQDNFNQVMGSLADSLGAAIGASRAAVDAGFAPNDLQVGQTGKVVAPDLYIAVGISGAIQHLAGMKESKVIVAINKDENAPIFDVADYGLVADLFEAVPELVSALQK